MEVNMLDAAGQALLVLLDPYRLLMLAGGVVIGLILGIVPGIGSLVGMAILLPFTYSMDPYTAFAVMLGMAAVVGTSDTIPAVLFGVPGSAGAQATVMDGNPMARRGEAGRALSAAYTSSLIGGLFGAFLLALCIPVLRPVIFLIGSPELLAISILGISMVAVISGSAPLRGLAAAALGIMLAMVGSDMRTGTQRWTMDNLYLWDGIPLGPLVLGFFALPELADMAIRRTAISGTNRYDVRTGMLTGVRDALRNWWLVLRSGAIGAGIGAIPGLGASIVDWLAYGHALQTEKGARESFGKGDVRGVIAPESANNAITAGSLVPTIAFGVPGSASMAILLGAFLIHGLFPGPDMLGKNLDITYSMVWSVAIANILGAGICFAFSGQLAKIALLRYTLILPTVIAVVFVGAFQASQSWGDLYALLGFAMLGWIMKQLKWPRPPLVLGFVLGAMIERYMFISIERYGMDWLLHPIVIGALSLAFLSLVRPFLSDARALGGTGRYLRSFGRPQFRLSDLFYVGFLALISIMLVEAMNWRWGARVGPMIVGFFAVAVAGLSFANQIFRRHPAALQEKFRREGEAGKPHMDTSADLSDLTGQTILRRVAVFFAWMLAFILSMALMGVIPTIPLFVVLYMRVEGREPWRLVLLQAVVLTLFVYALFDQTLSMTWPPTLLGEWVPALTVIPSM